jgi:hypothetical protein
VGAVDNGRRRGLESKVRGTELLGKSPAIDEGRETELNKSQIHIKTSF